MKPRQLFLGILALFVAAFLFLIVAVQAGFPTTIGALMECLPLGWFHFLRRNIPQLTWNWVMIGSGLIFSALILAVGHWFLATLFRQVQTCHPGQIARGWLWRWTFSLYAGIWLLFVIAFGAGGVFRHTTWLMESPDPLYRARGHTTLDLKMADLDIRTLMIDGNEELEATRREFLSQRSNTQRGALFSEQFNVIFYGDSSNKVAAYVIIPRRQALGGKPMFAARIADNPELLRPMTDLQRTLDELDATYPSKTAR